MMKLPPMAEMVTQLGSLVGGIMVAYAMFQNYFPYQLLGPIKRYTQKFITFFNPNIEITFAEYDGDSDGDGHGIERSHAYACIKRYLNDHSTNQAKRLRANVVRDSEAVVLTMADQEEVTVEFKGVKLRWASRETPPATQTITWGPWEDSKRFFSLTFHRRSRETICGEYLRHVMEQGKAIAVMERRRKLFTNSKGGEDDFFRRRSLWSHVVFDHPATFETLAMDPKKK